MSTRPWDIFEINNGYVMRLSRLVAWRGPSSLHKLHPHFVHISTFPTYCQAKLQQIIVNLQQSISGRSRHSLILLTGAVFCVEIEVLSKLGLDLGTFLHLRAS